MNTTELWVEAVTFYKVFLFSPGGCSLCHESPTLIRKLQDFHSRSQTSCTLPDNRREYSGRRFCRTNEKIFQSMTISYWLDKVPNYFPFKKPISWYNWPFSGIHVYKNAQLSTLTSVFVTNMAQAQKTSPADPVFWQGSPMQKIFLWLIWWSEAGTLNLCYC